MSKAKEPEVRTDVWNAILDYRSGLRYVWRDGKAEPAAGDQVAFGEHLLPTMSEKDFLDLKNQFAQMITTAFPLEPAVAARLSDWASKNLPTAALPPKLRGDWNATLKRTVRNRFDEWFRSHEAAEPLPDTTIPSSSRKPHGPWPDTEELREAILLCIRRMTRRELLEIRLPASALLSYGSSTKNPSVEPRTSDATPGSTRRTADGT